MCGGRPIGCGRSRALRALVWLSLTEPRRAPRRVVLPPHRWCAFLFVQLGQHATRGLARLATLAAAGCTSSTCRRGGGQWRPPRRCLGRCCNS